MGTEHKTKEEKWVNQQRNEIPKKDRQNNQNWETERESSICGTTIQKNMLKIYRNVYRIEKIRKRKFHPWKLQSRKTCWKLQECVHNSRKETGETEIENEVEDFSKRKKIRWKRLWNDEVKTFAEGKGTKWKHLGNLMKDKGNGKRYRRESNFNHILPWKVERSRIMWANFNKISLDFVNLMTCWNICSSSCHEFIYVSNFRLYYGTDFLEAFCLHLGKQFTFWSR